MDSRTFDRSEPSHIHVPRPSRLVSRQMPHPPLELDERCCLAHSAADPHLAAGDAE